MTEEQEKDDRRFRRYVARENLVSLMNDTKWYEAIAAIQAIGHYRPSFRVKSIRSAEPPADQWSGDFPNHVPTFREIEMLELNPVVRTRRGALVPDRCEDFREQIEAALREVNVPFEGIGNAIRITGYFRTRKT